MCLSATLHRIASADRHEGWDVKQTSRSTASVLHGSEAVAKGRADVRLHRDRAAPECGYLVLEALGACLVSMVVQDQVRAAAGQRPSHDPTELPRCPREQRNFPG